jgi:polar amino acid transport system permease protein
VYLVIAAIYFCLCYPLSQGLLWLERKVRAGIPLTPRRRRRFKRAAVLLEQEGVLV